MYRIYSFAPQLTVEIHAPVKVYLDYFDKEYWFCDKHLTKEPNIILRMVSRLPNKSGPFIVRRRLKFKNLFWYEYLIHFDPKKVEVYVTRHSIEKMYFNAFGPFIQTNVLEPLLYYMAIKKGYYLLHASTAEQNGRATCFVGKGGDGKTMTVLNECVTNNLHFMGDDLILVQPRRKEVYWFPRPLHLFSYNILKIPYPNIPSAKFVFLKLWLIVKIKDVIRSFLSVITRVSPLISTRVDMRNLYPTVLLQKKATLDSIRSVKNNQKPMKEVILESSDLRKDLLSFLEQLPNSVVSSYRAKELLLIDQLM